MEYQDLDLVNVHGALYDFLDELILLFEKYGVYEVKKCDDGIFLDTDDGNVIFTHYEEGSIEGLKVQSEWHSYYRYGDPDDKLRDGVQRPRVLNKTPDEEKRNNDQLYEWYDEVLEDDE